MRARHFTLLAALLLAVTFASPSDAGEDDAELRSKAQIHANKLLKKATYEKTVKAFKKIRSKESAAVYYEEIFRVAREYLESQPDGPLADNARRLLCGSQYCEPASYTTVEASREQIEHNPKANEIVEGVTPPVKISAPATHYTSIARYSGLQGTVVLQAIIDKEGKVTNIEVLQGLPLGLTENAVAAFGHWQFEPARRDGEPIAVYYNVKLNFSLRL